MKNVTGCKFFHRWDRWPFPCSTFDFANSTGGVNQLQQTMAICGSKVGNTSHLLKHEVYMFVMFKMKYLINKM
jgi:hypothetical protein